MARSIILTFIVAVTVGLAALGAEPAKVSLAAEKSTAKVVMIPDKDWSPIVGSQGEIIADDAPSMMSYRLYLDWLKATRAGDTTGLDALRRNRAVIGLPKGTNVLIIKRYQPRRGVGQVTSSTNFARSFIQESLAAQSSYREYPTEVRVLDGELKDQVRFVPGDILGHLVPAPTPKVVKPRYRPKPVDPATRAATTLRSAENLERTNKLPGAIGLYRQVVKDFPGTPQAEAAAARIRVLTAGSIPPS